MYLQLENSPVCRHPSAVGTYIILPFKGPYLYSIIVVGCEPLSETVNDIKASAPGQKREEPRCLSSSQAPEGRETIRRGSIVLHSTWAI